MAGKKKTKKVTEEKWVPIFKTASAYDFNEDTGMYEDSMSKVELRQNTKTKVVQAFVVD